MHLVPNWRKVLCRAWSVRLLALAGVLTFAEAALPLIKDIVAIPTGVFAMLSGLACGGAFVTRLLAQQSVSGDAP